MSYNTDLQENNTNLQDILATINALPEAGGGEDVELCKVTVHIPRAEGFMVASTKTGSDVTSVFTSFPILDYEIMCPKNSWIVLYAPDNQGWSFEGGVEYWGETWDYQTVFGWVAGDGYVELYQY